MREKYVDTMFFLYLAILLFFMYYHNYDLPVYKKYFYIGIKALEFSSVFGYTFFLTGVRRRVCWVISGFLFIRIIWEIGYMLHCKWADQSWIMDALFVGTMAGVVVVLTIHGYKKLKSKWQRLR